MDSIQTQMFLPSQVVSGDIENFSAQSHLLIDWIYNYRDRFPRTAEISNENGWQSYDKKFYSTEETFEPWLKLLVQEIADLVDSYRLNCAIDLTSLWFNINSQYSYNVTHSHPGALLSGVLWVKVPKDSGKFYFVLPDSYFQPELVVNTEESYANEINLFGGYPVDDREGRMMIFPSNMPHRVTMNKSTEDRISISFNLIAK